MKTLIAWLIANMESITSTILIIFYEVILFTTDVKIADITQAAIFGPLIIVIGKGLMGGMPSKSTSGDIINLVLILLVYFLVFLFKENEEHKEGCELFIYSGIISLAIAIVTAIFTCRNMDEVVSRRMFYVNSNADIFDITLKYTFNRFVITFSSISSIFLFGWLIKIILM